MFQHSQTILLSLTHTHLHCSLHLHHHSSTREPAQVFKMLETVYGAFDEIARRRKIFKVETVGDCYVAVCGMPEPRKDHAVAMIRFARECLTRMALMSQELEVSLGPGENLNGCQSESLIFRISIANTCSPTDTAELGFRVGIHSGPVTGGVLRGQNSRFQLFGDTVSCHILFVLVLYRNVSLCLLTYLLKYFR
jgi:class 3 adenylate cyclase